jgi:plastocyanin
VAEPAPGTPVQVSETEFAIAVSPRSVSSGPATFTISNTGTVAHNVVINGPGAVLVSSDTVEPGSSTTMSLTLQPGTYEVYCSSPGHQDRGMLTSIAVR